MSSKLGRWGEGGQRANSPCMIGRRPGLLFVGTTVLALVAAACGGAERSTTTPPITTDAPVSTTTTQAPSTTTAPQTTTTASESTGLVVYFLLDQLEGEEPPGPFLVPVHREVSSSGNSAQQAVEVLLAGPTPEETAGTPSISTAIPEETQALGGSIVNGVATVNLSGEFDDGGGSFGMFARLAQVVYTLTRLPDIHSIAFEIEGESVTVFSAEGIELDGPQQRDDYFDLLPPIFVDRPAWGEPVSSPIQVSGLSNVFEAVSQVMLTDDDGEPLFEDVVRASCGTGCWGEWSVEVPYEVDRDQFGALIVWEFSAKDGSRIHIREYPVRLE